MDGPTRRREQVQRERHAAISEARCVSLPEHLLQPHGEHWRRRIGIIDFDPRSARHIDVRRREPVGDETVQIPLQPTPIPVYLTLLISIFMHGSLMHLFGTITANEQGRLQGELSARIDTVGGTAMDTIVVTDGVIDVRYLDEQLDDARLWCLIGLTGSGEDCSG